ncbi:MAG: hypothetical protein KDA70_19860 [Planctomycetaceae bacterium]|nr:hypothetical protein [Planctomycetaceae bacterium]
MACWPSLRVAETIPAIQIVASADSQILNQAERWFNLARVTIETRIPDAWIVDLSGE